MQIKGIHRCKTLQLHFQHENMKPAVMEERRNEQQGKGLRKGKQLKRKGNEENKGHTFYQMEVAAGSLLAEDTSPMIINDRTKINSLLLRIGTLPVSAASCCLHCSTA